VVSLFEEVKKLFDPKFIMNPGKKLFVPTFTSNNNNML
jgi:hypothetical protein